MRRWCGVMLAVLGLSLGWSAAGTEEVHCKLYPKGGLLAESYDLVGAEACKALCVETDGCTAWSYTPHNFNPKDSPGWCRVMAEAGEQEDDDRDYCGRL